MFANHMSDKNLIPRIYINNFFNSINTNNPIEKWTKNVKRQFSKEDIQMINKDMKICQHH